MKNLVGWVSGQGLTTVQAQRQSPAMWGHQDLGLLEQSAQAGHSRKHKGSGPLWHDWRSVEILRGISMDILRLLALAYCKAGPEENSGKSRGTQFLAS